MRFLPLVLALLTTTVPAAAEDDAWRALAAPGTAALMRHAEAPGIGDPEGFRLDDCATQRTLNDAGRAQARAAGAALKSSGIRIDRVLTSQWCRCVETAELLAVAPVEPLPALNSFRAAPTNKEAQIAELRRVLSERTDEKLLLVTHQVVIAALTGRSTASGEIVIVAPGSDGALVVRGRIKP